LEQRISKLSLDKGNKLKEGHEGLPREKVLCVCEKERKRRRKCEEEVLVLMCGERCSWKRCVQESNMEGSCV